MRHDPLLLDLYGSVAEPSRWPRALDRLCDETGARSAVIQVFDFEADGVRLHWQVMDGHTTVQQGQPQRRLTAADNPRLARHRGLRGLNRVVGDDELFDCGDPAREALQQRLAQQGIGRFLGTLQWLEGDRYLGVALHRAVDDRRDFDTATSQRLTELAPYLRQACELSLRMQRGESQLANLRAHLDGLRCGLLSCDAEGRVHWMNRSARILMTAGRGLQLQGERLRAHNATASAALHRDIAQAGEQTRFASLGQGEDALHLALRKQGDDQVLIAVTRAGNAPDVPLTAWSRLLGVTAAEAALVATLTAGGTIEQHAARRGVSTGTVRGQLKQVLSKTGTHRQAELVCLALSSAAAHMLDSVPA